MRSLNSQDSFSHGNSFFSPVGYKSTLWSIMFLPSRKFLFDIESFCDIEIGGPELASAEGCLCVYVDFTCAFLNLQSLVSRLIQVLYLVSGQ